MDHNSIVASLVDEPIAPERPLAEQRALRALNEAMQAMSGRQLLEFAYRPQSPMLGNALGTCVGSLGQMGYGGGCACPCCGRAVS